jgi:hypothetical protein
LQQIGVDLVSPLAEIVVSASPGAFALPAPTPLPLPEYLSPFDPVTIPAPAPLPRTGPLVTTGPLTQPFRLPSLTILPNTAPGTQRGQTPAPDFASPLTGLRPPVLPLPGPLGSLSPLPDLGPIPKEDLDRCKKRPSRKRKSPEPRLECYRGTYTELSRGLIKNRKEEIPCQ